MNQVFCLPEKTGETAELSTPEVARGPPGVRVNKTEAAAFDLLKRLFKIGLVLHSAKVIRDPVS